MAGLIKQLLARWRARQERQRLARQQAVSEFRGRQLNPDFGLIEDFYGKPISPALRSLYEDQAEVQRDYVTKVIPGKPEDQWICICWYEPLDRQHIEAQWEKPAGYFEFANDGSGSTWVVDPTDDQAIISFFEHETGELVPTGVTMAEFRSLQEPEPEA